MLGSLIGDTVGSIYEFNNIKTKYFELCQPVMRFTDDSILTFATADWLLHGGEPGAYYFKYAMNYPNAGYGGSFISWVLDSRRRGSILPPYNSYGNGSAMRVSPVGWAYNDVESVLKVAEASAACTHNHIEGIKGAQALALSVLMARQGIPVQEIRKYISTRFNYDMSLSVDEIRPRYSWSGLDGKIDSVTCQGSVPQALTCAFEATNFEDAIRNAVSIGGDSDTIACMAGAVAEALFGVPRSLFEWIRTKMTQEMLVILDEFQSKYGCHVLP
ncbi:MAG: ADP-ribosylglycohydrolase family protein [Muribaculaceae bacterium]|nr:ADP-ribosylglycohydrolase family protein [Muribaculaceae bacterium]